MLHRLALALGRTVGEIEHGMSVREFADWHRFCLDHPLPFELVDIHAGQLLAMLFNINKTKSTPVANPRDFMVLTKRPPPKEIGAGLTIAQRMKAVASGRG